MNTGFKISIRIYVTCFLIFISIVSKAQENLVARLLDYKKLLDKNQIEKIHLHTNQPFYIVNDTIWFKAYVIDANLNRPSIISHSLTIDLVDPQGQIIRQEKVKLNVGLADGYLRLSETLKPGNYVLRAYTNSMKKFGKDFYYQKELVIKYKPSTPLAISNQNISLSFFPEGGDLIENLPSTVGFKAVGTNDGKGVEIKGNIIDDKGNLITAFASEYLGMGRFQFRPEHGRKYTAELHTEKSQIVKFQMPNAKPSGYTMEVGATKDSLHLKIRSSVDLSSGPLTVIAAQDGIVRYALKLPISRSDYYVAILKSTFYTGIIQFTLFDALGLPVAERLSFCNHFDFLKIETTLKPSYRKKELVNLLIDLKNIDDQGDVASLSVSVYSESAYPFDDGDEHSIYSDLLLTTDLKGFIEQPNAYFNKVDDKRAARNLDNLLLTQGWRRFSWKDKLSKKLPAISEHKGIDQEISGKVTYPTGKPYSNGEITLFQTGLNRKVFQTRTDTTGYFIFKNVIIDSVAHFILSTNKANEKENFKIQVFGMEHDKVDIVKPDQFQLYFISPDSSSLENKKLDDLYFKSKGMNLNQVDVFAKKNSSITESANLNGPGKADAIVLANDLETTHDLSTYLLNHVNGLKTFEGKIYSRDIPSSTASMQGSPAPMLVILDGVPLNQEDFSVSDVNPSDVSSVEVLKGTSAALYGINGSGGVLIISLKKGMSRISNPISITNKGILSFSILGYQKYKEFYSPEYGSQHSGTSDFRKSIYWNPKIVTSTDKKVELKFFNSDYAGKFKIVVEGINADGQVGRSVYSYEVK